MKEYIAIISLNPVTYEPQVNVLTDTTGHNFQWVYVDNAVSTEPVTADDETWFMEDNELCYPAETGVVNSVFMKRIIQDGATKRLVIMRHNFNPETEVYTSGEDIGYAKHIHLRIF